VKVYEFGETHEKTFVMFQCAAEPWWVFKASAEAMAKDYHVYLFKTGCPSWVTGCILQAYQAFHDHPFFFQTVYPWSTQPKGHYNYVQH